MVHEHLETFHDLPVFELDQEDPEQTPPPAPGAVAWRVSASPYDDDEPTFQDSFDHLLDQVDPAGITAIVAGWWGPGWEGSRSGLVISALAAAADRLTALEAIFLGDILSEESEISWIEHDELTPLLTAFPRLKRLDVRGGTGLTLAAVHHDALETLRFETGGLPAHVVRAVGDSTFPALCHLELWLGSQNYSGDSGPDDWAGILSGSGLPALTHLGLQDSEIQDEVAAAVAAAPIVARLESLDLSMGTLGDEGAEALLSGQPLTHLRTLDLGNHYCSAAMIGRLHAALPGVDVRTDDRGRSYDFSPGERYIAVSE